MEDTSEIDCILCSFDAQAHKKDCDGEIVLHPSEAYPPATKVRTVGWLCKKCGKGNAF